MKRVSALVLPALLTLLWVAACSDSDEPATVVSPTPVTENINSSPRADLKVMTPVWGDTVVMDRQRTYEFHVFIPEELRAHLAYVQFRYDDESMAVFGRSFAYSCSDECCTVPLWGSQFTCPGGCFYPSLVTKDGHEILGALHFLHLAAN